MAKTLYDLVNESFGVKARAVVNPEVSSVGTTALCLLSNNPNRLAWYIINLSTNNLYIHFENDVSSSKGIWLDASGGIAKMIWREDFNIVGWAIWGVADGASSSIYVVEMVSY